jgi:cell division protease FtsH
MTSGAAADLKAATQLARRMVCQWGMSDRLGPVTFSLGEDHLFLGKEMAQPKDFSEHTAQIIDDEITELIKGRERQALDILKEHLEGLRSLAEALLENETLDNGTIDSLLESINDSEETIK